MKSILSYKNALRYLCFLLLMFVSATAFCGKFSDEDLVLAEVFLEKVKVSDSLEMFYAQNTSYLPLREVLSVFKIEPVYTFEEKKFADELNKNHIEHNPAEIVTYEQSLYVSSALMERLINARIDFSASEQRISFYPQKPFPLQEEWDRQKRAEAFDLRSKNTEAYGNIITGTDSLSLPFVDFSAGHYYSKDSNNNKNSFWGGSAHAFGPTGSWDSDIYYYDMNDFVPASVNLKTSRFSPEGDILGFLKKVEIGDIYSSSSPVSGGIMNGYGISLSTYEDSTSYEKTFNIRDVLPSGWEVELYRNGEMLGYQRTSTGGYYEFSDITLYQGENKFTIVFYGPQGQIRHQERIIFYRGNVLNKGEKGFRAYAVNKNKNITHTGFDYSSYQTGLGALAEGAYGISDSITARAGVITEPVNYWTGSDFMKEDKTYISAGLSMMVNPFYFNLESLYDLKRNSPTLDAILQTNLYGFSLNLENNYFNDAVLLKNIYDNKTLKNIASADISKDLNIFNLLRIPFTLTYKNLLDHNNKTQNEYYLSVYQNIFFNIYAGASYRNINNFENNTQKSLSFYFSKFYKGHSLRTDAEYNLDYHKLSSLTATLQLALFSNMDASFSYGRNLSNYYSSEYINRYGAGLNFKTKWGYFNIDGGHFSDHSSYVSAGYSLSFAYDRKNKKLLHSPDKLFDSGIIAAGAFVDTNKNKVLDKEDKDVERAPFRIYPNRYAGDLDYAKNSYVYFPFVRKYTPYKVSLDVEDLDESFALLDANSDKYVRVRPGEIVYVNYPLYESSFIEGDVLLYDLKSDKYSPLRGIKLNLVEAESGKIVNSVFSEYDGYYSFDKVPLGDYKVTTDAKQLNIFNYRASQCKKVVLDKAEEPVECKIVISKDDENKKVENKNQ